MSDEENPLDLYARATRAAHRQLAFTAVGSITGLVLVLSGAVHGGGIGGIGGIALGLLVLIPFTALRVLDPTRWGTLRDLGETGDERKKFLLALRDRLADPSTPTIVTKYGALHLLSDVLVFADTADVEVLKTADIVGFSAGESRQKERIIRIETRAGKVVEVPMNAKDVAAALRKLQDYGQGSSAAVAA